MNTPIKVLKKNKHEIVYDFYQFPRPVYKDIISKRNFNIDDDNTNMMITNCKEWLEGCKQPKLIFNSLTLKQFKGLQLKMCRKPPPSE